MNGHGSIGNQSFKKVYLKKNFWWFHIRPNRQKHGSSWPNLGTGLFPLFLLLEHFYCFLDPPYCYFSLLPNYIIGVLNNYSLFLKFNVTYLLLLAGKMLLAFFWNWSLLMLERLLFRGLFFHNIQCR